MATRTILVGKERVTLPVDLCTDQSAFLEILSPDTWNNYFTDDHREQLMKFLPDFPGNDLEEKTKTLEMFFMQENFRFGTPISDFFSRMSKGHFDPGVVKMRKMKKKLMKKAYKQNQKQYFHNVLEDVLVNRQYFLDNFGENNNIARKLIPTNRTSQDNKISIRAAKRYMKEIKSVKTEAGCDSDLSDDDTDGPCLWLNKKQRRQLCMMESTLPPDLMPLKSSFSQGSLTLDLELDVTPARNPFDPSEEYFKSLALKHTANKKIKNLCSMDTRGISLQGVMQRSDVQPKRPVIKTENPFIKAPAVNNKKPVRRKRTKDSCAFPDAKRRLMHTREDMSSNYTSSESDNEKVKAVLPVPTNKLVNGRNPNVRKVDYPSKNKTVIPQKEIQKNVVKIKKEIKEEDIKVEVDVMDEIQAPIPSTNSAISTMIAPELTQETHLSFFSLLREVICSTPQQRMTRHQLETTLKTWQDSAISPLNEWFHLCQSWMTVLPSAITFLCGNITAETSPPDFVPYIEYKAVIMSFQWIGAGRDSDANLEAIFHHWFNNRDTISNDWPGVNCKIEVEEAKPLPVPRMRTPYTVKPSTDHEKKAYHLQEKNRYERPHKAFTFRMHGYESVIGPVKGIYCAQSGSSSKARGHSVLIDDRPPYVTILSLVRDAVARLPNGEGSKADICQLLKESQYVNSNQGANSDGALNSVISGALDRLQYGKDPSVKFDTSRKLWVYLHRDRTEEDLERMHHLNGPQSGGKSKVNNSRKASRRKEEIVQQTPPPNVTMEQFTPSIRQMDGSEVKVKAGDMLENWVQIPGSTSKDNQTLPGAVKVHDSATVKSLKQVSKSDIVNTTASSGSRVCVVPSSAVQKMVKTSSYVLDQSPTKDEKEKLWVQNAVNSNALKSGTITLASGTSPNRLQVVNAQQISKQLNPVKKKVLRPVSVIGTSSQPPTPTTIKAESTVSRATLRDPSKVQGIKLIQYPGVSTVHGKSNQSIVMDNNSLQALVGQKIVVPGNRLVLQGGKVIQTLQGSLGTTGILAGNKVLTGVLPGQHLVAVSGLKSQKSEGTENNVTGGRFVQIAAVDPSGNSSNQYQKVTIVPSYARTGTSQKISDSQASTSTIPRKTNDIRVKLSNATQTINPQGSNIITLAGGKQIILTSKGSANISQQQLQQLVVSDPSGEAPKTAGGKVSGIPQQIVLPASALQGTHINLKRLQAYQSFKVIPASQVSMQQKGKPVVAQLLSSTPSSSSSSANIVTIPVKSDSTPTEPPK